MECILETYDLKKKYRKSEALNGVNIHIFKGNIYGLVGKNGAGKTTLIRIICGLQKPTEGSYKIYGVSNEERTIIKSRRKMGAIIEAPSINFEMTAKDNLIEQCKVIGLKVDKKYIEELLKIVNLTNAGKKKAKNFSLGMKQRLGIAIALVGNPEFIILDEPINGLDPEGIIELRELILKLNKENKITFLISSHYLDELSKIATNYGFLDKGKITKEITREELEHELKKQIEIKVDNIEGCTKYLKENNIKYETKSDNSIIIYATINVSDLALELSKNNCKIKEFREKEENLESYYMKLIGGE